MPLDATPGGPDANSFLTVERADELAGEWIGAEVWTDASPTQQEAALISATRLISRLCFEGTATASTQQLPFPRTGLTARSGYVLDTTVIPLDVEYATFEMALTLLKDPTTANESDVAAQGISEVKAGSVHIKFRSDVKYKELPGHVLALLPSAWLCDPTTVYGEIEMI